MNNKEIQKINELNRKYGGSTGRPPTIEKLGTPSTTKIPKAKIRPLIRPGIGSRGAALASLLTLLYEGYKWYNQEDSDTYDANEELLEIDKEGTQSFLQSLVEEYGGPMPISPRQHLQ